MNPLREMLFGDVPLDRWPDGDGDRAFPWGAFVAARRHLADGQPDLAEPSWREVLADAGLESRHHLQAWHFLRGIDRHPPPDSAKDVLGVVVEVGMPPGLDILAAYADHSARYHNYSGAAVIWERPDGSLDPLIDELLAAAATVTGRIGPWDGERPPAPPVGQARLSFLTPSGLHFGQGPMDALAQDGLAGPVLQAAIRLMIALTRLAPPK